MTPPRVLTVTLNPAIDVSVTVDALVPDHKLRAIDHRREPGGGGVNVTRVLHRLGIESVAFMVVGGAVGDELLEQLSAAGHDTCPFRIAGDTRESVAITEDVSGRQYRVVLEGPHIADPGALSEAIVSSAEGFDIVVLSGSCPPGVPGDFYRDLTDTLQVTTVVDCAGVQLAEVVQGSASLIKPARRELASLVAWTPANRGEIEAAAREVMGRGQTEVLAVSLGAMGALVVEREGSTTWFEAPDVGDVVSTVGSGDAMVAGMVSGLVEGYTIRDSVALGIAAGSATVLTPGTALCDPEEVTRLHSEVRSGAA